MTEHSLVVIGIGGFGREVLDVIAAENAHSLHARRLLGAVDDAPSQVNLDRLSARGVAYLGTTDDWLAHASPSGYVVGIGAPHARAAIAARWNAAGHRAATVIHPAAVRGSESVFDDGVVVCAGAQISTNVRIGAHTHINPNATIGHDTTIDAFVSINPGAVVSGDVTIESGSLIGAGAVILQGVRVGAAATIGAAACVVRDVPDGATVKGIPAR